MICKHPRECFLQPAHKRSTAVIRLEYVETRNTPFIEHRHGFVVDRRTYDSSGIELLVAAQRLNLSAVDVLQQQAVASGQFIRDPVREASVGRKLCIAEFGILIAHNSIALDAAEQPPLRRLRRANVRLLLAFSIRAHDVAHEARAVRREPYAPRNRRRSEEHTSELQSLMRISYAVFCLKKKKNNILSTLPNHTTQPTT